MRILNDNEMDAVAGGQGHTITAKVELPVKTKSKSKPVGVMHTQEMEEEPGDGGGDGGGGDAGGGDAGDGGDTGGDDGHGNDIPAPDAPVDDAQNDIELAKAEADPDAKIAMTCDVQNGNKVCVAGTTQNFLMTTIDKTGNSTIVACSLNPGYSFHFSLDLFKSIRGGQIVGDWKESPAFSCKPLTSKG